MDTHGDARELRTQLRLALEATGLALWTYDFGRGAVDWALPPTWLPAGSPPSGTPAEVVERFVHPEDHDRVLEAFAAALPVDGPPFDVELRLVTASAQATAAESGDGTRDGEGEGEERWLLVRATVVRDAATGAPVRLRGILLDVTDRARARSEYVRLLQAERRASRRAAALQRVAAALSEAATTEQVAAVMVEESLRSLGVAAARIELRPSDPITGDSTGRAQDVVRSAGAAALLAGPVTDEDPQIDGGAGHTRLGLTLSRRGRYRGRWTLAWRTDDADGGAHPPPLWSPDEWTSKEGLELLRTLGTECGQAMDRAELYEQQRDIATVLQRTLLPSVLPDVDGALIAARYSPGGRGVDVGGDWYDVIALPDGRSGLVIGDVEGHSAAAAAVMGQVRNALRAYAVEGSPPSIVMERVNRLLIRLRVSQLVSCCYLEFAPTEGTATVVLAGHPPPLLVSPDGGCEFVRAAPNLVLGVDEAARYVETTVLLDPADCLLLYTDGMVESVSRSLPDGLAALRRWAAGWDVDEPPDELVERLIRLAREGLEVADDVAVLALSYRPSARVLLHRARTVRRTFPLDPTSASAARRFVGDVLGQWHLEAVLHPVTLMTSELVTNSVLHTSGELELALSADDAVLRVEVADHSERLPTLQHPDADAPGGRGLLIIEALAHRWGVAPRADGKAVWFEVLIVSGTP